jgi:hypothetical protein
MKILTYITLYCSVVHSYRSRYNLWKLINNIEIDILIDVKIRVYKRPSVYNTDCLIYCNSISTHFDEGIHGGLRFVVCQL